MRAFDFDENALGGIRHRTFQLELGRKPIDKRTKADALDGSAHNDFQSLAVHGEQTYLTKQPVHEPDLINEKQTEYQTEHAGGRADVAIEGAKTICRICDGRSDGGSD